MAFNTVRIVKAYMPLDEDTFRKVYITTPVAYHAIGRRVWKVQNGKKKPCRARTKGARFVTYSYKKSLHKINTVVYDPQLKDYVPTQVHRYYNTLQKHNKTVKNGLSMNRKEVYRALRFKNVNGRFLNRKHKVQPNGKHYISVMEIYSGVMQPWETSYKFPYCNYAEVGAYHRHVKLDAEHDDTFKVTTRLPKRTKEFTTAPVHKGGKFYVEKSTVPTPYCVIDGFTEEAVVKHRKALLGAINSINNEFYTPTETTRPYNNCDVTVLRQGERFEVEEYDKSITKYEVNAMLHSLIKEDPETPHDTEIRLCGENYLRKHRTGTINNSELLDFEEHILKTRNMSVEEILKDLDRREGETCKERRERAEAIAELLKEDAYDHAHKERTPMSEAYEDAEQARIDEFYSKYANRCRTLQGKKLWKAKQQIQERHITSYKREVIEEVEAGLRDEIFFPSPRNRHYSDKIGHPFTYMEGAYIEKGTHTQYEYVDSCKIIQEGDGKDKEWIVESTRKLCKVAYRAVQTELKDLYEVDTLLGDAGYDSFSRHEIEDVTYNASGLVSYDAYMQDSEDNINEAEAYEDVTDL